MAIERLLLQPRGGIIVLGTTTCPPPRCGYLYRNLQVLRLTGSGQVVRHRNISHEAWKFDSVGMGPAGGFIVAGDDWELEYQTWDAFLPSGRVNRGFRGSKLTSTAEENPSVADIALQADGKFVLATRVGLWRRNPDGSADRAFGEHGRVVCGLVPEPEAFDSAPFDFVAVSADGKLVAAGGEKECGLVRYLSDGHLDPSFAGDGTIDLGAAGIGTPGALALFPDGSVLLAAWDRTLGSLRLARYTSAGVLDAGFGSDGQATVAPWTPG